MSLGVNPGQPISLGKVAPTPAATTKLTENAAAGLKTTQFPVRSLSFQSLPTNTDVIYIGSGTMNTTTLDGVLLILSPGEGHSFTTDDRSQGINMNNIYMRAAVNGEGVLSYVQFH